LFLVNNVLAFLKDRLGIQKFRSQVSQFYRKIGPMRYNAIIVLKNASSKKHHWYKSNPFFS
jgi:hypothetical protein